MISPVRALEDFKSASIGLPSGGQAHILDLPWGLDSESKLFPALISFLTIDGEEVTLDQRDRAITSFARLEDMHGFFMDIGSGTVQQTVWVDEIQFGIRYDSALVRLGFSGSTLGIDPRRSTHRQPRRRR